MTITIPETGEVITHGAVRESIAIAKSHGEKFFEQIVWQVEHEVWTVLGYKSWDDMREAEYADLGVMAPRADRPELVSRLRAKGLTQQQIADTVGVGVGTVNRDLSDLPNGKSPGPITNSRGEQRPATYRKPEPEVVDAEIVDQPVLRPEPSAPRRKPLTEAFWHAAYDLIKVAERIDRLAADDRFPQNATKVAQGQLGDLLRARDLLNQVIEQLTTHQKGTNS